MREINESTPGTLANGWSFESEVSQPFGQPGTNRLDVGQVSADAVKDYLIRIGEKPLLSAEVEKILATRIEVGMFAKEFCNQCETIEDDIERSAVIDTKMQQMRKLREDYAPRSSEEFMSDLGELVRIGAMAKETMIESNLRLVVRWAKTYKAPGMTIIDFIQEGNLGLMHAVEMFDVRKGYKFSTYATRWIREAITRAIANDARIIRLPVHYGEKIKKYNRVVDEMVADLGRHPTNEEVAAQVGLPLETIQDYEQHSKEPLSTDFIYDQGETLDDFIEDTAATGMFERATSTIELQRGLDLALAILDTHELDIMQLRFGFVTGKPVSQQDVGKTMGMSQQDVGVIEKQVLGKLRLIADEYDLSVFL